MTNKSKYSIIETAIELFIPTLLVIGFIALIGFAIFGPKYDEDGNLITGDKNDNNTTSTTLTVKQVEAFKGKTLGELCKNYGSYENLSLIVFNEAGVIDKTSCEWFGDGKYAVKYGESYAKDYVITQVYYDDELVENCKGSSYYDRYREKCDVMMVYVDAEPGGKL